MLNPVELLLVGYALGAVPSTEIGSVLVAALAKRFGVKPKDVKKMKDAADD